MTTGINSWQKFKLLLWKNWLLQLSHKKQLVVEILLPTIFFLFILLLRTGSDIEKTGTTVFPELKISNLALFLDNFNFAKFKLPRFELLYSPANPSLDKIVQLAAKKLHLGFKSYADAQSLENELTSSKYFAGVQFDDSLVSLKGYPEILSFSLRFPSESRTGFSGESWLTQHLYPAKILPGPRNPLRADDGMPVGYVTEGFIALQQAISMSYLELAGKDAATLPEISMQRYPYPPYIFDAWMGTMQLLMGFVIVISFLYPCTCITTNINNEKEKQLKEVMKIMGLPNWIHWAAWFVKWIIMMSVSVLIIIMIIKIKLSNGLAVLTYSSWTVLIAFFLVYSISIICFSFMMASFFSNARTAATAMGLVFFLTYFPYIVLYINNVDLSLGQLLGWLLILNTAMGFGLQVIIEFEEKQEGIQWSTIFTPVNVDDSLTLGVVMIMMLIGSVIYMIICLYVEQIFPGEFGVPKKWNFPCTKKFWCMEYDNNEEDISTNVIRRQNPEAFEREPKDKQIGLQVRNLRKKFGKRWAVTGLSINMYENEIAVLLGHNGAGKTTTISMLTGMIKPTDGTAIINGNDISNNIEGARTSMGICPQHNVLFDDMSVANHIVFFSRLKGLKRKEIQREVDKYLKIIDLKQKANTRAASLSGGMKRKLSVCCALCGGTKVVLLDEPSSGMDPAARRQLWDLLQAEKAGRTILLTTQFMDEADVLGDRIAIMCEGELKCHGTSFFLKKKFGDGYRLICVKRENCNVSEVTKLLNKYIPEIQPESDIGSELTYHLPDNMSRYFEQMFAELENKSDSLGLNGYGIGVTSMEEVFMKVGAESTSKKDDKSTNEIVMKRNEYDLESTDSDRKSKGTTLFRNQWEAMLTKKALFTWRNKFLFLIQNIMAIFFAMIFAAEKIELTQLPSMTIRLTQYPTAFVVVEVAPDVITNSLEWKINKEYANIVHSYGENYKFKSTEGTPFSDYILDLGKTNQPQVDSQYLVAATISKGKLIAWLNNKPLHTPPLTLNLLHNAMAQILIGPGAEIIVSNHPLPFSTETSLNQVENYAFGTAVSTSLVMGFISAFYILFVIKERVTRSKLLQFIGGVRIWTFWLTHFLWDMLTFTFTVILFIVIIALFQADGTFNESMRYFGVLIVFGCSVLPLTYLLAFLFSDPVTGFSRVSMLNILTGMGFFFVIVSLPIKFNKTVEDWKKILKIFPHFCLANSIHSLYSISAAYRLCANFRNISDELVCQLVSQCCDTNSYYNWETPGILSDIVYMLAIGAGSFILIFAFELQFCSRLKACFTCIRPDPSKNDNLDSDVLDEKNRIAAMTKDDIAYQYLVLDRVTKYYKKFLAVNQISLCVKQAECFGLLGVNGAGKTTTFKMMTGEERITYGGAYVNGMNLSRKRNSIYKQIGYCPQFDALFDDLTGRETLRIFCLLRGVPRHRIKVVSEQLAWSFGFMKHIDKRTKAYSGGNKRKLSTAIAVIGSPTIIYLDEPTSGLDPAARRQLWNMVCRIRDSGKSIILTSHSMEECEALCTRLAIMVNGELKCIGSTQHLKNRFSKGLVIKIKIRSTKQLSKSSSEESLFQSMESDNNSVGSQLQADIRKVKEAIEEKYSDAVLQEEHQGMLTFYVPLVGIQWSKIFGFIERNRADWNVEDYSISQTTLEEIFLEFAKMQSRESQVLKPKKRCCGCGSSCCS